MRKIALQSRLIFATLALGVWLPLLLPAQELPVPASLPPYHWAQDYFWQLQLRQPNEGIFTGAQPFSLMQIAGWTESSRAAETSTPFWHDRLTGYLQARSRSSADGTAQPVLQIASLLDSRGGRIDGGGEQRLRWRTGAGLRFSKNLYAHYTLHLDEDAKNDPRYIGRVWRGVAAYAEQAYGVYETRRVLLKIGRDYLRWGRGEDATLFLSDESRPLDQVQVQLRTSRLQFSFFTSKLNNVSVGGRSAQSIGSSTAQRYLTGSRFDLAFLQHRLQFGINQGVLYGSSGGAEWFFFNPFIIYHAEGLNEPRNANSFGSIDFSFYPRSGLEFYGELLIDDIQVERSDITDLEPDEVGVLAGVRIADPLRVAGLTTGLEYTRVTNRTYNSRLDFEKLLHRNRPIGHFLGNDFDRWLLHGRWYAGRHLLLRLQAELIRKGEGRIEAPFDEPWLESTLEAGYSEPFPTGVVARTRRLALQLRWHPVAAVFAELSGAVARTSNAAHVEGNSRTDTEIFLRLWFEWQKLIGI